MHPLKQWALPVVAVVAVSLLATPTHAGFGTETATFANVSPGEVVTIWVNGTPISTRAGVYNFINGSGVLTGNFSGFCIDISQEVPSGKNIPFTVANLESAPDDNKGSSTWMATTRANLIRELWANDYSLIGSSNSNAAAFQISIWEIVNETSLYTSGQYQGDLNLNVSSGSFRVSADSGTVKTANSWLLALTAENGTGNMADNLSALTNPTYQDYVVDPPVAVPTPPGLVLGLIGACTLLLPTAWRYRQRGANATVEATC